jgi:hypothetical protein
VRLVCVRAQRRKVTGFDPFDQKSDGYRGIEISFSSVRDRIPCVSLVPVSNLVVLVRCFKREEHLHVSLSAHCRLRTGSFCVPTRSQQRPNNKQQPRRTEKHCCTAGWIMNESFRGLSRFHVYSSLHFTSILPTHKHNLVFTLPILAYRE